MILWGKYLSYAVSFGIAKKIIKRIKDLQLNDDLINFICYDYFKSGSDSFINSDYYLFYKYTSLDT